jgi:CRP-like cAMP-binding protein
MAEPQPLQLPPAYIELIEELSNIVATVQPDDIYQFCANFFQHKLEEQRIELVAIAKSAQEAGFQFIDTSSAPRPQHLEPTAHDHPVASEGTPVPNEQVAETSAPPVAAGISELQPHTLTTHNLQPSEIFAAEPQNQDSDEGEVTDEPIGELPVLHAAMALNRGRRTSVSAESMVPSTGDDFAKVVIPKTEQQRQRIESSIANNFLFKNLDEEQYMDVVDAMAEKHVTAGEVVIQQGGIGDYFYVVESGTLDVYVSRDGNEPVKVLEYGPGGSFGELALMYNAPRAATVKATSDCVLWALDRVTFRRILMERTSRKRRMYELFLEEVPLLESLEAYERHKIADALESVVYQDGEVVIRQGDVGDNFYIIESGEAGVYQVDEEGVRHELPGLSKGDYFGGKYIDPTCINMLSAQSMQDGKR